jgi:acetyltransferase
VQTSELQDRIVIRPVRPGDELLIQQVFDGMSPEARYHRFLQAMPKLSPGMRRLLASVDDTRHRAWAAHLDDVPIGIVRIVTDEVGDLELSVAVVDAMHRRGVGRRLVDTALAAAAAAGRDDVTVLIHPENGASVAMFRRMGARFKFEFGLLVGRVPVVAARSVEVAA